jgi:outer membrane protein TolC
MAGEQQRPEPGPEGGTSGLVGRSIEEFVHQLRGFSGRARAVAGAVPGRLSLPALPSPPGAMSAAQLRAVAATIAAQRRSIAAMRAQLDAFDEQLGVVERVLDPLVEWSASWARLEEAVGDLVRRDGPDREPPAPA